jgi:radical SAM protein with 4Fe4S-binding SPASM domain
MMVSFKDKEVLLNTITMNTMFMSREASIEERLFAKPSTCSITFVTSWECNLRCSHCSVMHQLLKRSPTICPELCKSFVNRYSDHYDISRFKVHFLGGEAFLHAHLANELLNLLNAYELEIGVTTNLAVPLTIPMVRVIERSNTTYISLDGLEKHHNAQRKNIRGSDNPFCTTVKNIKALIKLGFADKLFITAAINDHLYHEDYKRRFVEYVTNLGIISSHISFGCIHPTKIKPTPGDAYLRILQSGEPITKPCCKFRFMSNFVIDGSNQVFADYFSTADSSIGLLTDSIEQIEQRHRELIKGSMACLQDSKCNECPVIGFCWGKCVAGEPLFGKKPSDYCDQQAIIKRAAELCETGEIWEKYGTTHCSTN